MVEGSRNVLVRIDKKNNNLSIRVGLKELKIITKNKFKKNLNKHYLETFGLFGHGKKNQSCW